VREVPPDDDPHLLELQSIITAFARLPPQDERDPERIAERRREGIVAKRRLADLVASSPEIAAALARTVTALNGDPADPRSFDALDRLLDAQSYRLSSFRTAGEEINYRRFFAINELAAVRQEVPEVFAAAHALILRLIAEGAITGLRIDHPDGLWDPAGYFRDLQRAAWLALRGSDDDPRTVDWAAADPALAAGWPGETDGTALAARLPFYIVAEKILEPGETLPDDWALHGTVGYEFARIATGLFVDAANQKPFNDLYTRFTGERRPFATIAYDAKDLMLRTALASETNVLARALNRISEQNRRSRDFTLSALRHALREVIAGFPVYRTYVTCREPGAGSRESEERVEEARSRGVETELASDTPSRISDHDRRAIERAVALARRRNPASDPSVFAFLASILLLRQDSNPVVPESPYGNAGDPIRLPTSDSRLPTPDDRCRFVMKFQQLTGPVMAKGVEDTAFYVDNRLLALNEVGGDPAVYGTSLAEFHRENAERVRRWPANLLTSSTHDTKRSEDVRARIAVLSELPGEWRSAVRRWVRLNRRHKTSIEGEPAPDRNDEYRFYQTLLGAWPWGMAAPDEAFVDRIEAFMLKAAREAQVHTSWVNPDAGYEEALRRFVRAALDSSEANPFLGELGDLRETVAHAGAVNALAQQLLKLTAPGVPDIYQGTELWNQSLVDPDNRRPVDYPAHARLLRELQGHSPGPAELLANKSDGRIKLFLTSRALAFRQAHPELFLRGDYVPLEAVGPAAEHVVAFARRQGEKEAIAVVPRLVAGLIGNRHLDPIGSEIWGETRLLLPDASPGTRYRDCFTGERLAVKASAVGRGLPLAEVFGVLPFALLERKSGQWSPAIN
jgi:(1->4)-alpha-D-glucan 1-alpha-D-glucosylmutase